MLDNNDSLLAEHPDWQLVLLAYAEIEETAAAEAAELAKQKRKEAKAAAKLAEEQSADSTDQNDGEECAEEEPVDTPSVPAPILSDDDDDDEAAGIGWTERLREVEGVPVGRLAPIHGKLIAFGWLKYLLQGRSAGILYRVANEGKRLLKKVDMNREALLEQMQAATFGVSIEEEAVEVADDAAEEGDTIAA